MRNRLITIVDLGRHVSFDIATNALEQLIQNYAYAGHDVDVVTVRSSTSSVVRRFISEETDVLHLIGHAGKHYASGSLGFESDLDSSQAIDLDLREIADEVREGGGPSERQRSSRTAVAPAPRRGGRPSVTASFARSPTLARRPRSAGTTR